MRRRIKQLITDAADQRSTKPIERVRPAARRVEMTRELALEIKADVLARRTFTYEEAADLLGCSAEKMRLEARGYPIIRTGRTHRIPECVFKLIVRDRALEGMAVEVPAAPEPH